jgi:hypothetical protein
MDMTRDQYMVNGQRQGLLRARCCTPSPCWCLHHGRRARTSGLGRKTRHGFL